MYVYIHVYAPFRYTGTQTYTVWFFTYLPEISPDIMSGNEGCPTSGRDVSDQYVECGGLTSTCRTYRGLTLIDLHDSRWSCIVLCIARTCTWQYTTVLVVRLLVHVLHICYESTSSFLFRPLIPSPHHQFPSLLLPPASMYVHVHVVFITYISGQYGEILQE